MGIQNYQVQFSLTGVGDSWTSFTNLQEIQVNIGRQAQLDQIKASTAFFSLRYPTGYASPITALVSGTFIRIRNATSTPYELFQGRINDVSVRYGIPYQSGIGQADYVDVTCESVFAQLGRMQGNNYAMAADTATNQCSAAAAQTDLGMTYFSSVTPTPLMSGTTVNTTWGDWYARICLSTNARLRDGYSLFNCSAIGPFAPAVSTINFSDTTNDATNQVYNQINFDSLADNFYTQVSVTPDGFATQTVTKAGATKPYRTYQVNTANGSNAQALDFANYLLSNYGTPRFAISSFTCMSEAQSVFALDRVGTGTLGSSVGYQTTVAFRGTNYVCIFEGFTMSATPAGSQFTYYVSGADLNAYMILNNATFGTLDNNKLGY